MTVSSLVREYVYKRANGRCEKCGAVLEVVGRNSFHADHIVTRHDGGCSCPMNLQALCRTCNVTKGKISDPLGRRIRMCDTHGIQLTEDNAYAIVTSELRGWRDVFWSEEDLVHFVYSEMELNPTNDLYIDFVRGGGISCYAQEWMTVLSSFDRERHIDMRRPR